MKPANKTAIWHGTQREFARLQLALAEHCECLSGMFGLPPSKCVVHAMLGDQSALDHLLYVYRTRMLFVKRELCLSWDETMRR